MLNENLFNDIPLLNDIQALVATTPTTIITFNDFEIASGNYLISEISHENFPDRERDTFRIPRRHGMGSLTDFWTKRKIKMKGYIKSADQETMETALDTLKQKLSAENGDLVIDFAGAKRKFVATLTNGASMTNRQHYHIDYLPFTLEFECLTPFGQATSDDTTTWFSKELLSFSEVSVNAGTAIVYPKITVIFDAINSVSEVSFKNNTRDETITITRTFSAGDILVIDAVNTSVQVNGEDVEYSGVIPEFDVGTTSFTLTTSGTSATFNLTISFTKNFL